MLPETPPVPPTLDVVQVVSARPVAGGVSPADIKEIGVARAAQLRELALGIGARAGLDRRSYEMAALIRSRSREFDAIFNFQPLLLDSNVLPPVLVEAENDYQQSAPDAVRVVDKTYRVHTQARFVSSPPNWRDYLIREFSSKDVPVPTTLLPATAAEESAWKRWVAEGWKSGEEQAESIYAEGLARLKRDYEGMVRYRILYAKGMVSRPFVARSDFGVTGSGSQMNVNETSLRMTALPAFNLDHWKWKADQVSRLPAAPAPAASPAPTLPAAAPAPAAPVSDGRRPLIEGTQPAAPAPKSKR